jgi:conjugative transfer protein TraD
MVRPFSENAGARVIALLEKTNQALKRNLAAKRRVEAGQRRFDTREWVVQRRERTRHLIELGGLVQKSGLIEITDDDRATLYGALLDLATQARTEDGVNALALWKRRGKRAFDAEAAEDKKLPDAPSGED